MFRTTMSDAYDPTEIDERGEPRRAEKPDAALRDEIGDLRWLMGNKRGRSIVWRHLEHAGVYRMSYVQGDPMQMAFNEGQRNGGQRLLALIMSNCADQYALMVTENSNARN